MMHPNDESVEPRRNTSSFRLHSQNNQHQRQTRKDTVRRTCFNGLPSLATNTVEMVVATLKLSATKIDENQPLSNDEDDDDPTSNIGQQIQAHLPDILLNNFNKLIDSHGEMIIPNEQTYDNVTLLFLDVSGFTSLTEQYSNDAHLGIDQLTRTLNSYFDKLVYEILIHGGDIYKFAGDAILAIWINEQTGVEQALKCALNLQLKCGAYETDVSVILRLKVALAYGPVRALFVGNDEFKHYLLTGDCVKNVNICEQLCEPGDIIITRTVYEKLGQDLFSCEFVSISDEIDSNHQHLLVKYGHLAANVNEDLDENLDSTVRIENIFKNLQTIDRSL